MAQDDDEGERPAVRDKRIDHLGFAGELDTHFIEPLKEAIRAAHPVGPRLEGDYFAGLIAPNDRRVVDASKWLRLLESKQITREQYLEAVTVSATVAERTLD